MLNEYGRAHICFSICQNTVKWFIRCEGRKCTFSVHLLRWMEVDRILCKVKCLPCCTRRCATAAVSSVGPASAAERGQVERSVHWGCPRTSLTDGLSPELPEEAFHRLHFRLTSPSAQSCFLSFPLGDVGPSINVSHPKLHLSSCPRRTIL